MQFFTFFNYFCLLFFLFFSCCRYSLIYIHIFYILLLNFAFSIFFPPFLSLSHHVCYFVLFSLLYSPVGTLLWPCFLVYVLALFDFNWPIKFLLSFVHQVTLLHFPFFQLFWFCFCVCVCYFVFVIICLILYLSFVWGSFFLSYFLFLCICFKLHYCHNKQLVESWFLCH